MPDRLSGQWVLRETRIPLQALIDNAGDGLTAEETAELYEGAGVERTQRILDFARRDDAHAA